MSLTCGTCKWFSSKSVMAKLMTGKGECRLNPPIIVPTPNGPVAACPVVDQDHSCSHHTVRLAVASGMPSA